MAQLFDIKKVTVGPRSFEALVGLADDAPVTTDQDPEGTERVLELLPRLTDHLCLGDADQSFGNVIASTELAHLLEHVTVELLAQSDIAGDVLAGQTVPADEGVWRITLACPDDVLVAGALSSAAWIMDWAFGGAGDPQPDIDAIVDGLVALVGSLGDEGGAAGVAGTDVGAAGDGARDAGAADAPFGTEPAPEGQAEEPAPLEVASELEVEPAAGSAAEAQTPTEADADTANQGWGMENVPKPRLVR